LTMLVAMATKVTRGRIALWAVLSAGLTALVWSLSAASLIYLVINLGLMLVQRWLCRVWLARRDARRSGTTTARPPRISPQRPLVDLEQADLVPMAGRKAQRLATLMRAGFPVPPGFVVCNHVGIDNEWGRRE